MANICATNYVIEGEKKELDALYQKMKELQGQDLGLLVKALGKNPDEMEFRMIFETAWTPCYEVTLLMKAVYPSLRIYYKAEEPGCEVYLKNDAEGKYFPETEADGHPFKLMTGEDENEQIRLIRAIQEGKIKLEPKK